MTTVRTKMEPPAPTPDVELMQTVRLQAQDVVSWYFSHMSPYETHAENMRRYWRGPSLAVTLQILALAPVPKSEAVENGSSNGGKERNQQGADSQAQQGPDSDPPPNDADEGAASWRKYLGLVSTSELSDLSLSDKNLQSMYHALPRRTKARLDAFLSGCMLAVSNTDDPTSNDADISLEPFSDRKQNGEKPEMQQSISIEDGLSGFQVSPEGDAKPPAKTNGTNGDNKIFRKSGKAKKDAKPIEESGAKVTRANSTPISSSILRKMSSGSTKRPQISEEQLIVRLELYIRSLYRVKTLGDECVVVMEPPRAIKARARYITSSFVASAGCVRSVGPVLFRLLGYLTKELLAVETISEDIVKVIKRVASEYEHLTSFASLAFLSSPEKSADSQLTPLILKYLKYIQVEWEDLVHQCELESMLSQVLDPHMRRIFKTVEFRSIGHLLEVCQEFRSELHSIEISPELSNHAGSDNNVLSGSNAALKQALRDLQREVITVNGHLLPPVTSRKDLIYLLSQMLNSRSITDIPEKVAARNRRKEQRKLKSKEGFRRVESCPVVSDGAINDSDCLSTSDYDSSDVGKETDSPQKLRSKRPGRRSFHLSTIDMLTRRLLIAASRTGTGGDAYFVVRDLFGDEDVEVVPSSSVGLHGRMIRPGTIDILVRLASVTIKCHASFDVYPKSLVGECEPLIQVHTTTTETIGLQEIRSAGTESSDDSIGPDNNSSSSMIVQERETSKTGWRTITIRPALYEKVEVWNTPS